MQIVKANTYIKPLFSPKVKPSTLVDFPFRNVSEISAYIDWLSPVVDKAISQESSLDKLDQLWVQQEIATTLDRVVDANFRSTSANVSKNLQRIRNKVCAALETEQQKLTKQGEKLAAGLKQDLGKILSRYGDIQSSFVYPGQTPILHFVLSNASTKWYIYPEFHLYATENGVQTATTFVPPGVLRVRGGKPTAELVAKVMENDGIELRSKK